MAGLMIRILTNVGWEQPGDEVNTTEWDLLTYKKCIITELFLIITLITFRKQILHHIIAIILVIHSRSPQQITTADRLSVEGRAGQLKIKASNNWELRTNEIYLIVAWNFTFNGFKFFLSNLLALLCLRRSIFTQTVFTFENFGK